MDGKLFSKVDMANLLDVVATRYQRWDDGTYMPKKDDEVKVKKFFGIDSLYNIPGEVLNSLDNLPYYPNRTHSPVDDLALEILKTYIANRHLYSLTEDELASKAYAQAAAMIRQKLRNGG